MTPFFKCFKYILTLGIREIKNWPEKLLQPFLVNDMGFEMLSRLWPDCIDGLKKIAAGSTKGDVAKNMPPLVKCPTLIVHGSQDAIVPIELAKIMHKQIIGSELFELPQGKHNPHIRYPDIVNTAVAEFLQRVD